MAGLGGITIFPVTGTDNIPQLHFSVIVQDTDAANQHVIFQTDGIRKISPIVPAVDRMTKERTGVIYGLMRCPGQISGGFWLAGVGIKNFFCIFVSQTVEE